MNNIIENTTIENNNPIGIRDVAESIFKSLEKKNKSCIMPIFAFNGTGKTRLSMELVNIIENNYKIEFLETYKLFKKENKIHERNKLEKRLAELEKKISEEEINSIKEGVDGNEDFELEKYEGRFKKTLCFNAYFVDIFNWDNENCALKFDINNKLIEFIKDEGLENKIIESFQEFFLSESKKIEPSFDFDKGKVSFILASGDDKSTGNIKISKGEESIFIWSTFFVIIKNIFDVYMDEKTNILEKENTGKNRWEIFENLEYIIIDDPVSSVDDTKIIDMAMNLIEVINKNYKKEYIKDRIQKLQENSQFSEEYIKQEENDLNESISDLNLKFIITTHHALFYNICYNSVGNSGKNDCKKLYKKGNEYLLEKQGDTPFSYHIHTKNIIQKAIDENNLQRYHFNLFRALLEKTANFLGYHNWDDCITSDNKLIFAKILNNYSHGRFSELETNDIYENYKNIFIEEFQNFIKKFNFKN